MGIRKKILLGFVLLGGLLLLAGIISYFEFARMNQTTQALVDKGARSIELSTTMLNDAEKNHEAVLQYFTSDTLNRQILISSDAALFKKLFTEAKILYPQNKDIDSISYHKQHYDMVVSQLNDSLENSLNDWYMSYYKDSYNNLTYSIKRFMVSSQRTMVEETANIENNAYRAIMPGIIALLVAVIIIITFFFLIDTYYINPVVRITKSLKSYLTLKIPFKVSVEGRDEVSSLKEYIEQLIATIQSKKNE